MKRTVELWYLMGSMLIGTTLCVAFQNWWALFFCANSIGFQIGMYWWRREAWRLKR